MFETTNSTAVWTIGLTYRLSDVAGEGGKWGYAPRDASTHFIQPFKNVVSSKNLDQICLKMRIFEKSCKIAAATGDLPLEPLLASDC